ncbi:MAG: DUF438 domain-containing protein [bacterium]|nr:DUF438 domain-containing protein [bacterium]
MSELINNRELRKETLKDIIRKLHEGKTVEEVKAQFEEVFQGVAASEISEAEAALIMEGVPVTEIQSLCDVHASVFKGSIEEIHMEHDPAKIPGHPVNVLIRENRVIEKIIQEEIEPNLLDLNDVTKYQSFTAGINHLAKIDIHYLRKENLIFPYMEKYGVTAPPKVMWGVDDEIRAEIKGIQALATKTFNENSEIVKLTHDMIGKVKEMIFKEENILIPMMLEKLTEEEWKLISDESEEFGYLVNSVPKWVPVYEKKQEEQQKQEVKAEEGVVNLPSGNFTIEELVAVFNSFPFDITFVGKDDEVKFFSEGKERIFPRTRSIIGRNVSNCHPPASVHIVEEIVKDFKAGKKENEDFWIQKGDLFILIRYFAVRSIDGEYLGVLEVTQNVKPIRDLTGEKRLVSE